MTAIIRTKAVLLLALSVMSAHAGLKPLSESEMSGVAGRDGLTLNLRSPGMDAAALKWVTDSGTAPAGSCSGGISDRHGCTWLEDISITGVSGPMDLSIEMDVGAAAGTPALRLAAEWNRIRTTLGSFSYAADAHDPRSLGRSFGQFALESGGSWSVSNTGGIFDAGGTNAFFDLDTTGELIYRQGAAGSPELSLGNLDLALRFSNGAAGGHLPGTGTFGVDAEGVFLSAPYAWTDVGFDLLYKESPGDFDTTGRGPMLFMGWQGGLRNMLVRVNSGGLGYNTVSQGGVVWQDHDGALSGQRSEGLNLLAEWDFDTDFAWTIGESGGDRNHVRLHDWRRLGNASGPMLSMPVMLDLVQNASGAAGLCFGGGFGSGVPVQSSCTGAGGTWLPTGVPSGSAALAAFVRDGRLHAYNQKVDYVNADGSNTYDWTLVFTLGKLDADIFFYPEGLSSTGAASDTGLRTDITLLAQSPGFWAAANSTDAAVRANAGAGWETNTHFLVGDTNVGGTGQQFAVGLVNADLHWQVRDLYLRVTAGDSRWPELPGGFWMQTDNQAQYRFRGILGGANLADMTEVTSLGLLDVNLLTDQFIFSLSPGTPDAGTGTAPIAFNGLLDLAGASASFAEVSSPQSEFRIENVTGRIAWKNGEVGLRNVGGEAELYIANELLFGRSASFGGTAGEPLVGEVNFGAENFGRIALPEGRWRSDISIRIPQ